LILSQRFENVCNLDKPVIRLVASLSLCPLLPNRDSASEHVVNLRRLSTGLNQLLVFCLLFGMTAAAAAQRTTQSLWASHQARVSSADLVGHDVVVVPLGTALPVKADLPPDQTLLARFNPALVQSPAVMEQAVAAGITVIASVVDGRPARLDTADPRWADFICGKLLPWALERGFSGCVLDEDATLAEAELLRLVSAIQLAHPALPLFMSTAGDQLRLVEGAGCLIEMADSQVHSMVPKIRSGISSGRQVLAVVTSESQDPALHQQVAAQLKSAGASAFVTLPGLPGFSLAPLRERSRRVLVLYGWDPAEAEKPMIPETDSMTGELLQAPLEFLGYEAEYLDVASQSLPSHASARYAAVFLDGELLIPGESQPAAARWLAEFKEAGRPVLFLSGMPFSHDEALSVLRASFGLQGTLESIVRAHDAEVVAVDADLMNFETPVVARVGGFTDLQAPVHARHLVRLRGKDESGRYVLYDPAFLCDWGGVWFDPHLILRGSQDSSLFFGDPYRILAEVMGHTTAPLPAPDVATRDGLRIFYSHIDGDGFGSLSDFRGHPFCAELVRDRILKQFPLPVTVSIVQADMEALGIGIKDEWKDQMVDIARSIFALPNVSAASHSFAHPYQWDHTDSNPGKYTEPFMTLKPDAPYKTVDLAKEIDGSVGYINQHLLPPGKSVELMLWSGNCRPGREALRRVRELGIENMNGGNTIVSRLYPGLAGVAPRVMRWGEELQIYAANQNEFMYANGWNGPFFGGFADVIDTFRVTEGQRRLKPVNVYYHFYSATSLSSLRALEKIHHWCMEQPLHPLTARTYARIVRDAHHARMFQRGPRYWEIRTGGDLRSFRLPKTFGEPDLEHCAGVLGWTLHGDCLLVNTDGSRVVKLQLRDVQSTPPDRDSAHLRLVSSDAELHFSEHDAWKATFQVDEKAMRTATIVFSGLPAASRCDLTIRNTPSTLSTDAQGRLTLSLPPGATVTIDAQRARLALLR
jgi:hypothetical protein